MTQLVVAGNRIIAHGNDCFLSTGGTVICTETGRKFENATVVTYDGALPFDIDKIGYEFHAGAFVPCAPFGVGDGNIAVVCGNDCKAVKDSGQSMQYLGRIAEITYTGGGINGSNGRCSVTVDFVPEFAIVTGSVSLANGAGEYVTTAVLSKKAGVSFVVQTDEGTTAEMTRLYTSFSGNTIEWYSTADSIAQHNASRGTYTITVFGN